MSTDLMLLEGEGRECVASWSPLASPSRESLRAPSFHRLLSEGPSACLQNSHISNHSSGGNAGSEWEGDSVKVTQHPKEKS